MKDLIIYGSGGLAKEVIQLINDINSIKQEWNILGFIDDTRPDFNKPICGYRILGSSEVLKDYNSYNIVLAIGDPKKKKMIYEKTEGYNLNFPTLIHPTAKVGYGSTIGMGSILGIDTIVSVNVNIGQFVLLNMRSVIGHDVTIGDFSSCLVNSVVAGSVTIQEGVLIGSNSVIMERTFIGKEAKIGMGAIVYFDVPEKHIVMTKPPRPMFFGDENH